MGMDDEQWELCRSIGGKQLHYGFRERHLTGVGDVTGVNQESARRTDQQIYEGRFKCGAEVFAKDESLRVIGMHLKRRLRRGFAVFCALLLVHVHCIGCRLGPGGERCQRERAEGQCGYSIS